MAWAQSTTRIAASTAPFWRTKHAEDPAGTEATLVQLYPVPELLMASASVDPNEEIYAAVYPTREQYAAAQEAAMRRNRIAAAAPLTDDEYDAQLIPPTHE